jgi:hypothetical protein
MLKNARHRQVARDKKLIIVIFRNESTTDDGFADIPDGEELLRGLRPEL